MRITEDCIGCLECLPYCPQGAIRQNAETAVFIDKTVCVECGVCADSSICPADAIEETNGETDLVKKQFGRLVSAFSGTKEAGRSGGFDVKKNDVTKRIPAGLASVRLEINRPFGGARLGDLEAMRAFLDDKGWAPQVGGRYQGLLDDGIIPEILDLKVLTAMFEMTVTPEDFVSLIRDAREHLAESPLWASINIACRWETYPRILQAVEAAGLTADPEAKFNLGWGRKTE